MARRTLFNMSDCILKTTIKIGAREGLECLTARKIAGFCDVTDATVFVYFKNKQNLLLQAYKYVFDWTNNIIERLIENSLRDNTLTDEKWNVFFGKLVENVDNAKYFCNYRYSGRCFSDVKPTQRQIDICKNIITKKSLKNNLTANDYTVIWGNIMESVAYYAIQVADGRLANSIQKYELIRELLFSGYRE